MKKNFVLDTNVLLHDPRALFRFEDNNVIIPIYVIEELDNFKKDQSELGRNARQVARYIDYYRRHGTLSGEGVELPDKGNLRVLFTSRTLPGKIRNSHGADNQILAVALELHEKEPQVPVVFVSKDTNLRIRADAMGLRAEDYDTERVAIDELYSGQAETTAPGEIVDRLYEQRELPCETLGWQLELARRDDTEEPKAAGEIGRSTQEMLNPSAAAATPRLYPNQFVLVRNSANPQHTVLARAANDEPMIRLLQRQKDNVWGIRPRNKEQTYAFDLLLDDSVRLVTLTGKAGTGKTLLAIAAGLSKVVDDQVFKKPIVSRPIFPLGKDLGYLPGTIEEKLNPWMKPIFDNCELIVGRGGGSGKGKRGYKELIKQGILEIEPLTYIRGRSIPGQYIIIDEAQNLTPHEVKTIVTRAGDGTKIVLTGDPYQIDHPYVDSTNNGLVHVLNRFKSQPIAGHVTMLRGERSDLAELAANLL